MARILFFRTHSRWDALTEAYAANRLDAASVSRVDEHVAGCMACAELVASVRTSRAALSALPEAAAPRSFLLSPGMVARPTAPAAVAPRTTLALRVAGFAAAASVAVFAVLVGVDVAANDPDGDSQASMAASELESTSITMAGEHEDNLRQESGPDEGRGEASATAAAQSEDQFDTTAAGDSLPPGVENADGGDADGGYVAGTEAAELLAADTAEDDAITAMRVAQITVGVLALGAIASTAYFFSRRKLAG